MVVSMDGNRGIPDFCLLNSLFLTGADERLCEVVRKDGV